MSWLHHPGSSLYLSRQDTEIPAVVHGFVQRIGIDLDEGPHIFCQQSSRSALIVSVVMQDLAHGKGKEGLPQKVLYMI